MIINFIFSITIYLFPNLKIRGIGDVKSKYKTRAHKS